MVRTGGEYSVAVWREGRSPHRVGMPAQDCQQVAVDSAPHACGVIEASRNNTLAVRGKYCNNHLTCVPCKSSYEFPILARPESSRLIIAGSKYQLAVGRESDFLHCVIVI